jgi:hypothetical protein
MEAIVVYAIVDDNHLVGWNRIVSDDIPLYFLRYGNDFRRSCFSILPALEGQQTAVIDTDPLPETPARAPFPAQAFEKSTMRAATTAQNILAQQASETDDHITTGFGDNPRSEPSETPQAQRSPQRNHRDMMNDHVPWRRHAIFAAKQMDLVSQIT